MNSILPFIIGGIATGAIYGLAGTGLVLTYKTSGVFNFGYGALATAAAYLFYWLHISHHMPWLAAMAISVLVLGPLLGLVMELVCSRLSVQRTVWKVVGTVGLILIAEGFGNIKYGSNALSVPKFLPGNGSHFRLFHANVSYDQVIVLAVSLVALAVLYGLFRYSRMGVSMRAVVDDPGLVDLQGTNPVRVRRIAWVIGSVFAALSGVLILPSVGLQSEVLTLLIIQAFGAAAVGYFSSIPLCYVGGLLLGILASVSTKYVINASWLSGLPSSLPFIILFVVLLITPRRRLVASSSLEARPRLEWHGPVRLRWMTGAIVLIVLVIVPFIGSPVVGTKLPYFTSALTQMILFFSLGLLVRTAGLVSLCTTAFAAVGAVAFSQFTVNLGLPWVVALVLAGLVAVPVGAVIALPAMRLSGLFLALATLGFGIMVAQLFYPTSFMFTTLSTGKSVPRPGWASGDKAYYFVVLAAVILTAAAVMSIQASRLGRMLRGLAESPVATSTLGLSATVTRLLVFCVAAFFAAVGGALYGGLAHFATSADPYYQPFTSLSLLAVLALAPFREPWYVIFAGITSVIPAYFPQSHTSDWLNVLFGVFAILTSLQGGPVRIPYRFQYWFEKHFGGRGGPKKQPVRVPPVATTYAQSETRPVLTGMEVRDLGVRFGGLVAVRDLSFSVPMGRITGLIGPNGAGKTTTFNACSGLNRNTAGSILLHGEDITRFPPAARARAGLGRTFQIVQLCESLSVRENVALGREAGLAGRKVRSQVLSTSAERDLRSSATLEALELCGIGDLAEQQAGALSTGQRRLVELARCLAGPFDLLMLDEPSSGLDTDETARFADVLRSVVRERGCGLLLVEHDIALVMGLCAYIYVLDFGELLFDGEPSVVAASPVVREAYLGSDVAGSPATEVESL